MYEAAGIMTDVQSVYKKLYIDFIGHESERVILTHFGELSEDLINNLTEGLEQVLIFRNCSPNIIKRMFGVVLDGLSNICLYNEKGDKIDNVGHIIIKDAGNSYSVSMGNVISRYCKRRIGGYLDELNHMEYAQLRELHNQNLWSTNGSPLKDIFVGFNTIALISKSKIDYGFTNFVDNQNYYLTMSFDLVE